MSGQLDETIKALEQVQQLDAQRVARAETLGTAFELTAAVPPVTRSIEFFRQIPTTSLQELGAGQRNTIKGQAENFSAVFAKLMSFDPTSAENAASVRQTLIEEATASYDTIFAALFPIVAYISARRLDPSEATRAAQETLEELRRFSEQGEEAVAKVETEATRVLDEVRRTAAESGVSQQAMYFGEEATGHGNAAGKWQTYTNWSAVALGGFALASLLLSAFWSPSDAYQATQIALSKILIFSTIAFMLFLCSRTLLAHRHNEVVNKHRQNALLTFNALVEATGDQQTRQVVLTHASACIFAPQETGFTKPSTGQSGSPVVEVLPRLAGQHAST